MEQTITIKTEIENLIENGRNLASKYPDEALELSEKALLLSRNLGDRQLEGYALISMALSYRVKSEVGSILDSSLAALHIFDEIHEIAEKMEKVNKLLALYMIDIDNFKRYNDYWGTS